MKEDDKAPSSRKKVKKSKTAPDTERERALVDPILGDLADYEEEPSADEMVGTPRGGDGPAAELPKGGAERNFEDVVVQRKAERNFEDVAVPRKAKGVEHFADFLEHAYDDSKAGKTIMQGVLLPAPPLSPSDKTRFEEWLRNLPTWVKLNARGGPGFLISEIQKTLDKDLNMALQTEPTL